VKHNDPRVASVCAAPPVSGPDRLDRQGKSWSDCAKVLIDACRYQNQIVEEANRESRFPNQVESADVERCRVPPAARRRGAREQRRADREHCLANQFQRLGRRQRQPVGSVAASGSADIDTAHVESIKQAIKDGTLQIDSGKIADGVLSTARELLQNKSSSTGN
jgi:flagellar biosynthesis anti-sigma factor FlgM